MAAVDIGPAPWDPSGAMDTTKDRICSPRVVPLSSSAERVLRNGPTFFLNVKPSRVEIAASTHEVAHKISSTYERSDFVDQSVKRLSSVVESSLKSESRAF